MLWCGRDVGQLGTMFSLSQTGTLKVYQSGFKEYLLLGLIVFVREEGSGILVAWDQSLVDRGVWG